MGKGRRKGRGREGEERCGGSRKGKGIQKNTRLKERRLREYE